MGIPSGQGLDAMELSWVDFQIYLMCISVLPVRLSVQQMPAW